MSKLEQLAEITDEATQKDELYILLLIDIAASLANIADILMRLDKGEKNE